MLNGWKRRRWAWPWELSGHGLLGINRRNIDYLFKLNPRRVYKLADDKILTKRLCSAHGISVPETYTVIECFGEVGRLGEVVEHHPQFVIKPASGSSGRGILIVVEQEGSLFQTTEGTPLRFPDLRYHVTSILSGLYSLGGQLDRAILEHRITTHPVFEELTVLGTPDIRVVMYEGMPAMAMLRLPTRMSRGRANLHQGAAAAGIDLETGRTFGGVCRSRAVTTHPDTGTPIAGLRIPEWSRMLEMAGKLMAVTGMGYAGVDIVLDADHGPLVLEVNARPGLGIQIANRCGLMPLRRAIDGSTKRTKSHDPRDSSEDSKQERRREGTSRNYRLTTTAERQSSVGLR
jgi:alpha-L-glutamate ligase-like protein